MKSSWTGIFFCLLVLYFGVVHSLRNPWLLLNAHAVILVIGGTVAIAFLTYSASRLNGVMDYVIHGFLFRARKTEDAVARDLINQIDHFYQRPVSFPGQTNEHPFLREAVKMIYRHDIDAGRMETILRDRRAAIKRKYMEDAKILNNIAKYPPHLGLVGAASGMMEMMSGLGVDGIQSIGQSMAIALSATLWGIALNNFVFLPLSDNSTKVSEDELHLRDMIIDCCLMMKRKEPHLDVLRCCLNRLPLADRAKVRTEYLAQQEKMKSNAA